MDYFSFDLQLFAATTKVINLSTLAYDSEKPTETVVYLVNNAGTITAEVHAAEWTATGPATSMRIGTIAADTTGTITLDIKGGADYDARETIAVAIYAFCGFSVADITAGNRISFQIANGKTLDGVVSDFFVENVAGVRICVDGITDPNTAAARSVAIAADGTLTLSTGTDSVQVAAGNAKIAATATTPTVFMNDLYKRTDLQALYGKLIGATPCALGAASITYTNAGTTPVAVSYQGADGVKEYGISNGDVLFTSNADGTVGNNTLTITMPSTGTVTISGAETVSTDIGTVASQEGGAALTVAKDGTLSNVQDGAKYQVVLATGKTATIGGKAYKEDASGKATLNVTKSGTTETVTLSAGTVTMSEVDAAVVTALGTVTNKAAKDLKVTAAGAVTSVDGGTYQWTVAAGTDKTVSINSKDYTNASPSTTAAISVTNTGGTEAATLTGGYVTIKNGAAIITDAGTVTSTNTSNAITVSSAGVISNVVTGAEYNIALGANKTTTIDGATYKNNSGTAAATLTVAADGTMTLSDGAEITVTGESATITTAIGTVQNKGTVALTVAKTGTLTPASGAVYEVVLDDSATLTVGTKNYKNNAGDSSTATLDVNNGVVTLGAGQVLLADTATAVTTDIGVITYTKGDGGNGITVAKAGTVSGDTEAGDSYTVALGEGKAFRGYTNASGNAVLTVTGAATPSIALTTGTVSFDNGKSLTVNGATITNTGTANHTIAVDTTGTVSQIAAGAKFSVVTTTPAQTFNYTMVGTTLAKIGAAVGVYTGAAGATVTTAGAVTGGTLKALTLTLDVAAATVADATTDTTTYYTLSADGTVAYNNTYNPASPGTEIGYFKAVTSWAEGEPTVTVTFVGGTATSYLGNINVDMTKVQQVTNTALTTKKDLQLVVTGISGAQADDSDISVIGLNKNATVSTSVGSIAYVPDAPTEALTVTFDATKTYGDAARLGHKNGSGAFDQYGVYAAIGEGAYGWYETVAAVKEAATAAGESYSIGARYSDGILTVANGGTGRQVTLAGTATTDLTVDHLSGVSIRVVESFDANGTATTGSGTGVVKFTATDEAGISITAALGESVKFENATLRAQIPAGATATVNGVTYTVNTASVITLAKTGTTATLDDGNVTVPANQQIKVNGNTYMVGENGATITATATKNETTGLVTTPPDYGVLTAGEAALAIGSTVGVIDANENLTTIRTATGTATVTSAGVVSGLETNAQVITVIDRNSKGEAVATTTYTVDTTNKKITVGGKYVGVYTFASEEATKAATITPVYGAQDTISGAATLTAFNNGAAWQPSAMANVAVPEYYKLKADGTLDTKQTTIPDDAVLGYFKVETSKTGGKTAVIVSFHDKADTTGTGSATLLADVTLDLEKFQVVGTNDVTTVDVTGISDGVLTLKNVPKTAAADIVGLKDGDAAVDYFATYALADGATITLPSNATGAATGTIWTYAISASEKGDLGVRTYSIGAATVAELAPVGPCFTVTKTVDGSGNVSYAVAFVKDPAATSADNLDNLNEACWANGVTVDASQVAPIEGKTVTIGVTPNGSVDVYTVRTQNGVIVTPHDQVTGSWTTSPATTIKFYANDGTELENQWIELPATVSTTTYWKVEKVNDGNNQIKITSNGTTAPTTNGDNYIKVVRDAAGKATVTYHGYAGGENNTPTIPLSDLGVTVAIRPESDAVTEIVISDDGKGKDNCVDWAVTAYAGTTITGKGTGDADVTWLPKYKNAATINLDALAASTYESGKTYYYAVTATADNDLDAEGYRLVTLASETPATDVPGNTVNYFAVKKESGGVYTVTYVQAAGTNAIALSAGKATLSVNENETITSITETVADNTKTVGDMYFVDQATDKVTAITVKDSTHSDVVGTTNATYVEYVEVSRWTYNGGGTEINLSTWDGAAAREYNIDKAGGTITEQGVTSYELGGANADGKLTFTYTAPTTVSEGYITVTLTQGTLTKAEIEKIANAIKINATLNAAIKGKVAKIVLTDDSKTAISYDITNLSADIGLENFTSGTDTVTYAETFVMGENNAIALTAPAEGATKAATAYYAVTATDGKDTKGVRTVSISKTAIAIAADATPAQIAEALAAAGGNYFTVVTAANGATTVTYTSKDISLDGLKVNVDATAVELAGTYGTPTQVVTVGDNTETINYAVSGLDVGQTAAIAGGATSAITPSYNETFAFTYGTAATLAARGTEIALTNATSGTVYYEVVRTEGSAGTQGVVQYSIKDATTGTAPASGHYFAVTYAATGVSVSYYNVDGNAKYNLATAIGTKPQVAINAAGLNEAITAINITDGGSADTPKVNYALTEVSSDVEVVGAGDGDTVTTKPTVVLADGQKITLTDNATTYYVVSEQSTDAKGKVTLVIGEGTTTKPADTENYFVVKRTASEATGKVYYTISEYHASNGGAAYDLSGAKAGTITIDAAKATGNIILNNGATRIANFAVTNLPEFYVPGGMNATAPKDTVAYATTFAWPTAAVPTSTAGTNTHTYTYLVAADEKGAFLLTPGATATTSTDDTTTKYASVTVTKDEKGNFTLTVNQNYTVDATTGKVDQGGTATSVTSIAAPTTACEINASTVTFVGRTATVTPQITGVVAGTTIKVDDQDVSIVSGTLAAGTAITIIDTDNATTKLVYTAAEAGTISLRHNADAVTVESGVLVLGKGETLTSDTAAATTNSSITLASDDATAQVFVTFDAKKGITSITGLDIGETVTLKENNVDYTYTRTEDGYVVKTLASDSSQKTYAAMDASTIDILSLGYNALPSITGVVGTFAWNPGAATTYYLAGDSAAATVAYGSGTGDVTSGSVYIKADFTNADELTLTPMVGNAKGLLDPIEGYAGTITIKGDNHVVKFKKDKDATYTAVIDGVLANSEFTDLGASDTVATEALADGAVIKMHVTQDNGTDMAYSYKLEAVATATTGALKFTGTALTDGTVEVLNTKTSATDVNHTVFTSDGSKITHDETVNSSVVVVVKDGAISSIKGLATNSETVTVTKDGVTTTFAVAADGSKITKTVKTADGATTITTIATVAETTDVWTATGTNSVTAGAFAWGTKNVSGIFLVDANGATTIAAGAGAAHNLDDGEIFVKATITDVATAAPNAQTITLTPMIVKDGELAEATAAEIGSKIKKVTITGASTVLNYDGTGKTFNIQVDAAGVGSTFTNLLGGDLVNTTLGIGDKISVNGQTWTSTTAATAFTIYSESPLASRIVAGAIELTAKNATVNAATADGSATQTMTYTAGEDNKDGVQVIYAAGVPTSITDFEPGESVKVEAVGADGKKVVTEYTTADGSDANKMVVYRTRGGVVTVKEIANDGSVSIVDDTDPGTYAKVETSPLGAFDWTEAATKKTTVTGYFLASEKGVVEAATRTDELTTDYTQYGRTYLVATVTQAGGISLQKATVGMTGKLGAATNIVAGDKMDVTLTLPTAGLAITSLTGRTADTTAIKSLTIANAAAGTIIGTWTANDTIKTVSLKADETIKLGTVTYTAGAAGVMEVAGTYAKNGTFQLATGMTTISSSVTDTTTEATTVDAVTYTPNGTKDTANVAVTNGRVTGLTGFGAGETVAIVTTVTDKFGVATTSTATYTATEITTGLDKGSILVTKTLDDGNRYTHVFKDTTQDVLSSSLTWNSLGQDPSTTLFNWNNTGYFHATLSTVAADAAKKIYVLDTGKPVAVQTAVPTFTTGDYYLKVVATKAMSGLVTISEMSFVQMQSNGSFAAVKGGETLPKFAIDATATGGIAFADGAHPDAALTITPAMGKTYTGLVAGDQVTATTTAAGQTITVNGTAYTVTNASAFVINGDNTIESGTFTVTGTATAAKTADDASERFAKTVTVTGEGAPSVVVAITKAGGVTSVTDLQAGETVVVEEFDGKTGATGKTLTFTGKVDGANTTVTQTVKFADTAAVPAELVLAKTDTTANITAANVMAMGGYTAKNKFDFGATTEGQVGIFRFGATGTTNGAIQTQAAGGQVTATDGDVYMAVAATGSAETGYKITYAELMKYNATSGRFEDIKTSTLTGGVTITAPANASLELGTNAVQLYTKYKDGTDGARVIDTDETETERGFAITVTGAAAGKSYTGFDEIDTIQAAALKADDTITVNGLTYAVKADAAANAVQFRGNGAAIQGEFKFNSTYKEARGYDGLTLTTVTGTADATVTFAAGKLTSVTEIAAGESVTVTETVEATKATKTTTYVATANTDGTVKITRTIVEDGVTTTTTGKSAGDLTNIIGLTYTDATSSISSNFDWTVKNGSGYFFADVTLDGSTVKDIGTVEIKPGTTTISAADAGKYVAKVTVNTADGTADKIRLHKVLETGELGDEIDIPATATGTLNIAAPTVEVTQADGTKVVPALVFNKTGYAKLTVNVTGATNGSVITALAKGDKLTTTTLKKAVAATATTAAKAAEQVTVNGTVFVAGADGTMSFVDTGVLVDGAIVMNGALTVYATGAAADKYTADSQVTIAHAGADAPVVTVANGVVTGVTGLNGGSVTATIAATSASAKYEAGSVTVTLGKTNTSLVTLAMADGDTVKFGSPAKTLYSASANNKLEFVRDTGTDALVKNGALRMTAANNSFTAAGSDSAATTDNVTVTYTKKTTSSAVDVTVTNGVISAIKGLQKGDALQLTKTGETTVYTVDGTTGTKVTKTVTKGTETTTYTAFITEGADILAANYYGEGQEITEEENQIVGQLSWGDVSGRATGYFQVGSNKATIAEQSKKVTVTAAKNKTALWAVANAKTDDNGREALTIDAMQVQTSADGKTTTVLGNGAALLTGATITVTAPTTLPLFYNKTATYDTTSDATKAATKPGFAVVLNKIANGSQVQNIALGDRVTTATLKAATAAAAESVQMVEADGTAVTYTAGANGAMTFVGEGDGTATTPTGVARLLAGTVILTAGDSIYLAGGAEKNLAYSGDANDLTVTATGDANVIVKAANGVISTVTGLDTFGASLEVKTGTGTSAPTVKYTVVDVDNINKTVMIERVEGVNGVYADDATKTYRTVKTTADFYAGDQTKTFSAIATETPTLTDWTTEGTKYAFINTTDVTTAGTYVFTTTAAKTAGVTSDVLTAGFSATPNTRYYRLTTKTAKNGTTTISAVDAMEADATKTGKLVAVKAVNGVSQVFGTVTIDGATANPATENNGKISFALPAFGTKRVWTLDAKNLALGSVVSGLTKRDKVASGNGTYNLTKSDKTFTVYTNGTEVGTSTQVVTYAGSDGATAKVTGGVLSITNLVTAKEKVTIVTDLDTAGLVTTEYLALAGGMIQKTETAADGTKTVRTSKAAVAADADVISAEYGDPDLSKTTIVSDFNWTLDKSQVGYFAVNTNNNTAAVKTAKTTISTAAQKTATYIAVELDSTNGLDGVVKSVKAMRFNATTGAMEEADAGAFAGKITITAPTGTALTFDRTAALATDKNSVGENAQFVITGAAANSVISNLKARATYATCDSVTTAKLAKGASVTVGGNIYEAGVAGAIGFTMQQVNGADDERVTLTSGTIRLYAGVTEGVSAAIVGKTGIVANNEITVAASTKVSKGVATTSYTIGELGENESFQVKTYGDETITSTFRKSSSNLFYIADGAADDSTEGKYVYALAGKTSVSSGVLAVNGKVPTAKGWTAVKETFTLGADDFLTTAYGAVTVDLSALDKRYKADAKANAGQNTYAFVYDKYIASTAKVAKALSAAVVSAQDQNIQTLIGSVTGATAVWRTYNASYDYQTAAAIDNQIGQTIKATANWNVIGSGAADTITGASSGEDWLDGGAGNDSLTGGGAKDNFVVGQGQDTIKGFGSGKDTIWGAFANVSLQGADVLLWNDDGDDADAYDAKDTSVLLVGMGTKKAVNIGGTNYYFGSGKATKAEAFTFDVSSEFQSANAVYYGKAGLANTISVGTDKTKATATTLGDTLKVDLSNTDAVRYHNIASADASKSGNRVDLTAAATGSTLKGGTYQSTLRGGAGSDMLQGGSGVDVFWAADLAGTDTVKSYQTSKDALFLGNIDTDPDNPLEVNGFTIQASGKHVTLTNGESGTMTVENAAASTAKALLISKDGTATNTLSYYIGSTTAKANKFTAVLGTDMKSVTADDITSVTMSSYYLGTAATNVDTLTLKSTTKNQAIGKFDMNALSKYISTIDVIDTAGLAKGSTIELIGRESGTYTLKGSNNVTEKFNLKNLAAQGEGVSNNVTITNLGVGEIVELAAGMKVSMATSGKNTICTLTDDAGKSYGTLTISGIATSKLSYSSTTGTLTRTTK